MNKVSVVFFVLIFGSVLLFSIACHFRSETPITQTALIPATAKNSPTAKPIDIMPTLTDIQINPKPGDYFVDRNSNKLPVSLKSVSPIYADVLPDGLLLIFNNTVTTSKKYDPCLVLPFQVESKISKVQYLNISAQGYDANGNIVSFCLNWGPMFGQTVIEMQPYSINDVDLTLSLSKDLVRVEIVVIGLTDIVPP